MLLKLRKICYTPHVKQLTTIFVVRHGQTEFNIKNIIGGTLEPNPLSATGKDQVIKLGKRLKKIKLDIVYSSDLSRAKETAKIIADMKNLPVNTTKLLRERNWGSLQGKTFEKAQKEYKEVFLKESKIEGQEALNFKYVDDMESLKDTIARFKRLLETIVNKQQGKKILVVCHFDIMMGYLVDLGFGSYQELMNASFNHTGYYKLISDGKTFKVKEIVGLNKRR